MATPVTMPMLGLTMEEGTVAQWLKHEGDRVEKDEPLLTVEMDKGTIEVPSPAAGVLTRIAVPEGQTVPVKTVIAELGDAASTSAASPPSATGSAVGSSVPAGVARSGSSGDGSTLTPTLAEKVPEPDEASHASVTAAALGETSGISASSGAPRGPAAAPVGNGSPSAEGERRFASPRARLRARELGVALESITGSGPRGRVVEADVLALAPSTTPAPSEAAERVLATPLARRLALEHGVDLATVRGSGPGGRITNDDVLAAALPAGVDSGSEPSVVSETRPQPDREPAAVQGVAGVEPLSRVRRLTAERMAASARSVARVTLQLEADLTEAVAFRAQLQPEFARLGVPKLPWDALIARAAGVALLEHPRANAEWVEGQGIRIHAHAHVGIAVALEPEGLVVPVLRDADRRSLRELTADLLALVGKARAGRLSPSDMQEGTFSVTNLGQYRIDGFTPIVNPPQAAILGVGRIAERPAVVAGQVVPRTLCTLSLSLDHRVIDGAPAAAFLARLAELLERPYALLGI